VDEQAWAELQQSFQKYGECTALYTPTENRDQQLFAGHFGVDPELMIRMLLVGFCLTMHSEPRLCEEVHFNLYYR
jgi:hypothetical protein